MKFNEFEVFILLMFFQYTIDFFSFRVGEMTDDLEPSIRYPKLGYFFGMNSHLIKIKILCIIFALFTSGSMRQYNFNY